jgi:hypothetical protein
MKLLQVAAIGLIATEYAIAQTPKNTAEKEVYIPYDCYNESDPLGATGASLIKKSDRPYLPSMSNGSKPAAITGCWDRETNLITGMQTIFRDGSGDAIGAKIGKMSGTFEWSDKKANGALLQALEKYYFREAEPDAKDYYENV